MTRREYQVWAVPYEHLTGQYLMINGKRRKIENVNTRELGPLVEDYRPPSTHGKLLQSGSIQEGRFIHPLAALALKQDRDEA